MLKRHYMRGTSHSWSKAKPGQPITRPAIIEIYANTWHEKSRGRHIHTMRLIADGQTYINTLGAIHSKAEGERDAILYKAANELKNRRKLPIHAINNLEAYCRANGIIFHCYVHKVTSRKKL